MRPHISINVSNVADSVAFYEKMFGVKPQKQTQDYAKFDLKKPALNFSMQTANQSSGKTDLQTEKQSEMQTCNTREVSRVNHFGIEVDSADVVKMWEELFVSRGVLTKPEENTECCFARQDKVWVQDPDGNTWEIFYVHEQLPIKSDENKETKTSSCSLATAVFGKKCC